METHRDQISSTYFHSYVQKFHLVLEIPIIWPILPKKTPAEIHH